MATSLKKQPAIAVGAVIQNEAGDILLVRRSHPPRLGEWSIPGGKVEWGENVRDALLREIREETGLDVDILGLIDVVDSFSNDSGGTLAHHYVLLDYAARSKGNGLRPGDDVAEARWVVPGELARFGLWSETRRIIAMGEKLLAKT